MIAPASQQLAERFDIHNNVLLSMTISIFVLAYGVYLPLPFPTGFVIPCTRCYHSLWAVVPWTTQ